MKNQMYQIIFKNRKSIRLKKNIIVKKVESTKRGCECLLEILTPLVSGDVTRLIKYNLNYSYAEMYFEKGKTSLSGIKLDELNFIEVAHKLITDLAKLHSIGIIHGDIKPSNIINFDFVKYSDFGCSKINTLKKINVPCFSLFYKSPEVWNLDWNYKSDIWALGCTLYEIKTGNVLFPVKLCPWKHFDNLFLDTNEDWQDLIFQMLTFNPELRPDATQVLNHKIFENVNPKKVKNPYFFSDFYPKTLEAGTIIDKICGYRTNRPKGSKMKIFDIENNLISSNWISDLYQI